MRQLHANWCCICKHDEEIVNHLFLRCEVAQELWSLVLFLFVVAWVFLNKVKEVIFFWSGCWVAEGAPLVILWLLWGEKDRRSIVGI